MADNLQRKSGSFQLRSIVLATDFLESSRLALDYAVAFSHRFGATLTIVHALELSNEAEQAEIISRKPSMSRAMALARLEGFAAGVRRAGVNPSVDLREGEPCATVLQAAAENQCDLLVLGTHGIYRGLQHLILGSNAEKILLSAHCPTLTVGRHVMAGIDLDLKISEVIVISDLALESVRLASYGLHLAARFAVPVELVYVGSSGETADSELSNKLAMRYRDMLTSNPSAVDLMWLSTQSHLERIRSYEDVIRRAEVSVNSLIVTGVHRTSRIDRHLRPSFAFELAARAACPLFSVPSSE